MSKKMEEFFDVNIARSLESAQTIENIILDSNFLKGLGLNADSMVVPEGALITGSLIEAMKLSGDQQMMDFPQPWTHQNFLDQFPGEPIERELNRQTSNYVTELDDRIASLRELHQIDEATWQVAHTVGASKESIDDLAEVFFVDYLPHLMCEWLRSMFYSDSKNILFWDRVTECFEMGGVPCGWLGGIPFDEGGDPRECMVMCHLNTLGRPRELIYPGLKEAWP